MKSDRFTYHKKLQNMCWRNMTEKYVQPGQERHGRGRVVYCPRKVLWKNFDNDSELYNLCLGILLPKCTDTSVQILVLFASRKLKLFLPLNKRDLLREHKTHTSRRVASTCSAALSPGVVVPPIQPDGGTPSSPMGASQPADLAGVPQQQLDGVLPLARFGAWPPVGQMGVPQLAGWEYPPPQLDGVPPSARFVLILPPPPGVNRLKILASLTLRMRAVMSFKVDTHCCVSSVL